MNWWKQGLLWAKALPAVWRREHVSYLIAFVTSRCNLTCDSCFNWRNQDAATRARELTLDEYARITRRFGRLLHVTLTGGEPFLRADLAEIAGLFLRDCGALSLSVPTNGLFPDRAEAFVRRLRGAWPDRRLWLSVSLDGPRAVHEKIRKAPASFDKAWATVGRLLALKRALGGVRVVVSTTSCAENRGEIGGFMELVRRSFPDLDEHEVIAVRGEPRRGGMLDMDMDEYAALSDRSAAEARHGGDPISFVQNEMRRMMRDEILYQKAKGAFRASCLAGRKLAVMDDEGFMFPCEILPGWGGTRENSFGGLRDAGYSWPALQARPRYRAVLDYIDATRCNCSFECAVFANHAMRPRFQARALAGYFMPGRAAARP